MEEFEGRVAVVTGAASGIGRALARRAAAEGMDVVAADVEADALAAAVGDLAGSAGQIHPVVCDVSRLDEVEALAQETMATFGQVNLVCNNAGVSSGGRSWEQSASEWDWVLGVNLHGVIHGVRVFTPLVIASGGGHIVNTSSMAGLVSTPGMGPYNVSKHGVVALSETLYHELAMEHPEVGVSVLCPGWVNTNIVDADRNRPDHVVSERSEDPNAPLMREFIRTLIAGGADPDEVAGLVFDAVRSRRFWVFTHDDWLESVRRGVAAMLAGTNPEMFLPFLPSADVDAETVPSGPEGAHPPPEG